MKIQIKKLELTNFKCFRYKEINFDNDVTIIRGRNGVGKTTIADAILWCLFGKNTQGQSDFDLKTHDSDGNPIPNLDHSVEMCLALFREDSEQTVTIRRTLKETWVKRRGSDELVFKNNTTEYLLNGEAVTATDYKKYIASLINEDTFRAITTPTYFPSLKWQQQRDFLTAMVGDISVQDIVGNDADLLELSSSIDGDIIAYRKHLSYQIKKIKDKLDKIPVRLEEQHKALPECHDWDALQLELVTVQHQLEEVNGRIVFVRSGNGDDVRRDALRKELDENLRLLRSESESLQQSAFELRNEANTKVNELSNKFRDLLNNQRDIETAIPSFDRMIQRCRETLDQSERDAQNIRTLWAENNERKIILDDNDNVCPTCGQLLPKNQVLANRLKAVQALNQEKADTKQRLKTEAEKVKATRADAERQIAEIEVKKAEAEKNLDEVRKQINTVFAEKQKAEKELQSVPSFESLQQSSETFKQLQSQINLLDSQLQNVSSTSEEDASLLSELEDKKVSYEESLANLQAKLASKEQYNRIKSLIEGIRDEEKAFVTQLSELERSEDVASRYQERQNAILEYRINDLFSLVKWRMFRTVNNGGDPFQEPYCECYVNGVAYHDGLNQAARLNAGLDIINALCRHYNVSAPIVVDNSESNLNILSTVSQQIRLEVFNSELEVL